MAVELCRVALWIEALEPGKPLTFLDSHIRCGDSLIGVFDYEALQRGIPDEAYKPLTGDDKDTSKAYIKHNKQQRDGKGATGFLTDLKPPATLIDAARALTDMPEDTLEQIATKRAAFERLHTGANWLSLKTACDCYVVAFFAPKTGGVPGPAQLSKPSTPLTDHVWSAARGQAIPDSLVAVVDTLANAIGAFHWPIEFPDIFARGGFDAAVGNPPWERIKLQEQEFFAARSPAISMAQNKAAREKLIAELEKADPESADARLYADFQFAKRAAEAASEFARNSGRYPLSGTGDVNTYALFAEHFARLARAEGRAGVIVPTGIATDSSTAAFFSDLVERKRLAQLIDFENREKLFPAVDSRMKFCVLAMGAAKCANFAFFLTNPVQLDEAERQFTLTADQIAQINPNTKTAPIFRSRIDAELTSQVYGRTSVLVEDAPQGANEERNLWGFTYQTKMFDMADASHLFVTRSQVLGGNLNASATVECGHHQNDSGAYMPLYEAKMIHHFDHRWASYAEGATDDEESARDCTLAEKQNAAFEPAPRYWVPEYEVKLRAARVPQNLKRRFRENNSDGVLKSLAGWLAGYFGAVEGRAMREADLIKILGRGHAWRAALGTSPDRFFLNPKTMANGARSQREMPLTADDIAFLTDGPKVPLALASALIERKQPRWLMGWRDITNATNERTVIASVFPRVGVGHTIRVLYLDVSADKAAAFIACLSSLPLDYIGRQVIGGTHLTVEFLKQIPIISPSDFSSRDISFIVPRVLELAYTSHAMRIWAEDLGYSGPPFSWDEARRAALRAELDAMFALKYGLTRHDLRYILDPADVKGADYPSETFRGLKVKEEARFSEYRTQRLVLAAFDRLTGV